MLLLLLVVALALPMRLHGLMAMPGAAAVIAASPPPCHETLPQNAADQEPEHHHGESSHAHGHGGTMKGPVHLSLHCATAGLVVPVRLADLAPPALQAIEALAPAEMPRAEGLAPPRQERPPRLKV